MKWIFGLIYRVTFAEFLYVSFRKKKDQTDVGDPDESRDISRTQLDQVRVLCDMWTFGKSPLRYNNAKDMGVNDYVQNMNKDTCIHQYINASQSVYLLYQMPIYVYVVGK